MGFLDDYEPVENRIRAFWEDHPQGRITTDREDAPDGEYIFVAHVFRDGLTLAATGWAHESVDQLPANMKASALEVCETSAIGRALANLGYAPKGKRPSREEMSKTSAPAARATGSQERSSSGAGAGGSRPAPDSKSSPAPVSNRDERGNQDGTAPVAGEAEPQQARDGEARPAAASSHDHDWIPSPTLTKFDVCSTCGETKRKGARL